MDHKVIIITGPTGSGKTTLSKMVANHFNYSYVSGDEIKDSLFPEIEDITQYPDKLKVVKESLVKKAKGIFDEGNSVVVDYVILGEEYINSIKDLFGDSLILKVILPSLETIIERDKNRECWNAGEQSAKELYEKYLLLKPIIGQENYIDNTGKTPEETFNKYLAKL